MKIGILSDVHSNLLALDAVLREFERRQVDGIICCGDLIGIGIRPEETVQRVKHLPHLLACVRGNHEDYLLHGTENFFMTENEAAFHKWEHRLLSAESRSFLNSLPDSVTLQLEGKSVQVVHYARDESNHFVPFVRDPTPVQLEKLFGRRKADVILYGHYHEASVVQTDTTLFVNPGSVGCPGVTKHLASAGLLLVDDAGAEVKLLQLPYDVEPILAEMEGIPLKALEDIKRMFYGQSD